MNKPGFTIIELLIASAIAALLAGLLFGAFWQINKSSASFDTYVDVHFHAIILQRLLSNDIAGACIPLQVFEADKQKKSQEKKAAPEPAGSTKKQIPVLDHIFYSKQADGKLDIFTCITNNPLPVYFSEQSGKPKPKIARVVYRLQPEPGTKDSFVFLRQESSNLSFDAYGKEGSIRSYRVLGGIKQLEFSFEYRQEKEGKEKKKEVETKTATEWNSDEQKDENAPKIPSLVKIKAVLSDARSTRTFTYSFVIPIIAVSALPPEPAIIQKPQAPQPPAKPGELPAGAQTGKPADATQQNQPQKNNRLFFNFGRQPTAIARR